MVRVPRGARPAGVTAASWRRAGALGSRSARPPPCAAGAKASGRTPNGENPAGASRPPRPGWAARVTSDAVARERGRDCPRRHEYAR
jgi:hypothetical protein